MGIPRALIERILAGSPEEVWSSLFSHVLDIFGEPAGDVDSIISRDAAIGMVDAVIAGSAWDIWGTYEQSAPRTADRLATWWSGRNPGRAILILDGLSCRELPWLLAGAPANGFTIHGVETTGAELPTDTTPFANALGYSQRAALASNLTPPSTSFPTAATHTAKEPWGDVVGVVPVNQDVLFWHHWPDRDVHDLGIPGGGLARLTDKVKVELSSPDFWAFASRLATGRRLVITGDHGYASTGSFTDVTDPAAVDYLRSAYHSGRFEKLAAMPAPDRAPWLPPIDIALATRHGPHRFVLGRRKWRSPGGYPTLAHGGLSLLEVAVPFIELSRS